MSDLPVEIELTPSPPLHHASASTSTNQDSSSYDVFINYRGPDVKNTFASHLHRRLLLQGIRVFLDKPELKEGFNFTSQIQGAIQSASVHVAIFSPRYAESEWCLDELLQILESGKPVIPLFYHVKPSQLRSTKGEDGVYSQDLRKLEEMKTYDTQTHEVKPRHDPATIQKWREALASVAGISGFELDPNMNTDEGELLDKIVERVVKNVNKNRLDEAAKDSENIALLEEEDKAQQQQRGNVEVLLLWIEKLQILCDCVGRWLAILVVLAFILLWTTGVIKMTNDPFGINKRQKGQYVDVNQGRQRIYFHDGQVEIRNCATAHPIGWQFVFVLFMNMVVVYNM